MNDSRSLIEQSKELIATAREVVEESRRIREDAQSSTRRSRGIVGAAHDRVAMASAAKGSTKPDNR